MTTIKIGDRLVGDRQPVLCCAEIGCNSRSYEEAEETVRAAARAGADAIKMQTYLPGCLTLPLESEVFQVRDCRWAGQALWQLYEQAATPWEWQPRLKWIAESLGMLFFSTPFSAAGVDYLDGIGVPCFKVASFEANDPQFIRYIGRKNRPLIISTGMADEREITEALAAANEGKRDRCVLAANRVLMPPAEVVLLKCTSAYPADPKDANLLAIPRMVDRWRVPVGLSDHTLGIAAAVASVALGACLIEKHFCLDRLSGGPDSAFSLEPGEFAAMVVAVREAEASLGESKIAPAEQERAMMQYRRSLFVVRDIACGDVLTHDNVRSIRPAAGLAPKHLPEVLGRRASRDIRTGTPLEWPMVD